MEGSPPGAGEIKIKVGAGVFDFGYLIVEKIAHAKSAMG
jgi:hypothetical protein